MKHDHTSTIGPHTAAARSTLIRAGLATIAFGVGVLAGAEPFVGHVAIILGALVIGVPLGFDRLLFGAPERPAGKPVGVMDIFSRVAARTMTPGEGARLLHQMREQETRALAVAKEMAEDAD